MESYSLCGWLRFLFRLLHSLLTGELLHEHVWPLALTLSGFAQAQEMQLKAATASAVHPANGKNVTRRRVSCPSWIDYVLIFIMSISIKTTTVFKALRFCVYVNKLRFTPCMHSVSTQCMAECNFNLKLFWSFFTVYFKMGNVIKSHVMSLLNKRLLKEFRWYGHQNKMFCFCW